jgi:hypothetical protein
MLAQVGQGRFQLGKVGIGGGGDIVPGKEILGEGLGALQLRGTFTRTETAQEKSMTSRATFSMPGSRSVPALPGAT